MTAAPHSTIAFAAGTYKFTNSLNLANVAGVTIRGAGTVSAKGATWLDFSGVVGSGEGIVAQGTDMLLFTNFIAQDTKGNGIKVVGSNGVTWRNVSTVWTNPDGHTHGAYGLYPVQSHNILIENCEVAGAADAGIYVGQSDHIIVRNNKVHNNVAGIEIENSSYADVYGNVAQDNVGGLLIFNMPDLQINEGGWNHVYNNQILHNNAINFARRGSSVARVPGGTGAFVLAGHDVEVDHNTFTGNNAAAFSVVSYQITGDPRPPCAAGASANCLAYGYGLKQWPAKIYAHDNVFDGNGASPVTTAPTDCPDPNNPGTATDCPDPVAWGLGQMLALTAQVVTGTANVAPLIYDGIIDPSGASYGGSAGDAMNVCFGANTGATLVNLHYDQSGPLLAQGDATGLGKMTTDMHPYACTLPALAAVAITAP